MAGLVLLICLLLLVGLFVLLRYERYARRGSQHGELQEPLLQGVKRGIEEDLKRLRRTK